MVELYLNAQSDNGTLGRGGVDSPRVNRSTLTECRPCALQVVSAVSSRNATIQRPQGSPAAGKLDEKCWFRRSRVEIVNIAHVCLVEGYDRCFQKAE